MEAGGIIIEGYELCAQATKHQAQELSHGGTELEARALLPSTLRAGARGQAPHLSLLQRAAFVPATSVGRPKHALSPQQKFPMEMQVSSVTGTVGTVTFITDARRTTD